jgi:hypothetical protein
MRLGIEKFLVEFRKIWLNQLYGLELRKILDSRKLTTSKQVLTAQGNKLFMRGLKLKSLKKHLKYSSSKPLAKTFLGLRKKYLKQMMSSLNNS